MADIESDVFALEIALKNNPEAMKCLERILSKVHILQEETVKLRGVHRVVNDFRRLIHEGVS